MHGDFAATRRLLVVTYRRYLEADRALVRALSEMRAYFPPDRMPWRHTIGAPGSPIRRLHADRDRALLRLQAAHDALMATRAAIAPVPPRRGTVLLLPR